VLAGPALGAAMAWSVLESRADEAMRARVESAAFLVSRHWALEGSALASVSMAQSVDASGALGPTDAPPEDIDGHDAVHGAWHAVDGAGSPWAWPAGSVDEQAATGVASSEWRHMLSGGGARPSSSDAFDDADQDSLFDSRDDGA